jgi:hypothetical protein
MLIPLEWVAVSMLLATVRLSYESKCIRIHQKLQPLLDLGAFQLRGKAKCRGLASTARPRLPLIAANRNGERSIERHVSLLD